MLAEAGDLEKDNRDIDILVWDDAYSEDYAHKFTVRHQDIMDAISEEKGE